MFVKTNFTEIKYVKIKCTVSDSNKQFHVYHFVMNQTNNFHDT